MQVSIEARRLNKEQFPLNLLLYSNISLCLCPQYCTSMDGINRPAYRPRAHCGVLPCKHFCLPTSAMLHCFRRAVTRVLFLENLEKEQHPSLPCHVGPSTPHFKWSDYPGRGRTGPIKAQDRKKTWKCASHAEKFRKNAGHECLLVRVIIQNWN